MKKIIVLTLSLLLLCINLASCGENSKNSYPYDTDIDFSKGETLEAWDTHGGFLGDGDYFEVKKFNEEDAKTVIDKMKNNSKWKKLPMSKGLNSFIYGNTQWGGLAVNEDDKVLIPKIKKGYYCLIDRYDEKVNYDDFGEMMEQYSYNFTIAIFDTEKNKLYYYEYDS